jgi:hypothetical protein
MFLGTAQNVKLYIICFIPAVLASALLLLSGTPPHPGPYDGATPVKVPYSKASSNYTYVIEWGR